MNVCSCTGDASTDVLPVSGTLQFITAATQQSFVLSILPDTIPEVAEVSCHFIDKCHLLTDRLSAGVFC